VSEFILEVQLRTQSFIYFRRGVAAPAASFNISFVVRFYGGGKKSPHFLGDGRPNYTIFRGEHRTVIDAAAFQISDTLLHFKTRTPQMPNSGQISHFWGAVEEMTEPKGKSVIGGCFRFPIYCSISKSEHIKGDQGRKSRLNFALGPL